MPAGKPAGVRCVQLDGAGLCRLFGKAERPAFCSTLQPDAEMCGSTRDEAVRFLDAMEIATRPS
jgi:hypothetical protein